MAESALTGCWEGLVHFVEGAALRGLREAVCRMSWERTERLAAIAGGVFHVLCVPRRVVAMRNLRTAFGGSTSFAEADAIAGRACAQFTQSMFHFLRIPAMSPDEIRQRVHLNGVENYHEAAGRGQGVIILTAHLGNWELLGARLIQAGVPLTVIARYRSNQTIDRILRESRRAARMAVIEKGNAMLDAMRVLQRNGALGILPDQHAGNQGIPLEFFGRITSMHPVVARLARQTGAAVVPVYCVRDGEHGYRATIQQMLELRKSADKRGDIIHNTRTMTRILEQQIRMHPDQWLWVHKRWREEDRQLAGFRVRGSGFRVDPDPQPTLSSEMLPIS